MAYQLSDLVTRVQKKIKDTTFASANIIDYLNDAQNDIFNEYNLGFMEATQAYTLAIGQSDITNGAGLPLDLTIAHDLLLTTNGYDSRVPYMAYEDVQRNFPNPTNATRYQNNLPQCWYQYGTTIRVFPAPDKAYTVSLLYRKEPTVLANAGDVPSIPKGFAEYLVLGAAGRCMEEKDNYDQAALLMNRASAIALKLVSRYARKQGGQPTVMRLNRRASGN